MATYFVASGGSNTSPYDTWAKAATSLQTALTAASSDGDIVAIQYDGVPAGDAEVSADTTYTFAANVSLISSTNSGTSTITPTAMGDSYWIGRSGAVSSYSITMAGAFEVYVYGITLRIAHNGPRSLFLVRDGASLNYESCVFWCGTTSTVARITLTHPLTTNVNCSLVCKSCIFRFGATAQGLDMLGGNVELIDCSLHASSSIPVTLFVTVGNRNRVICDGCDFSLAMTNMVSATGTNGTLSAYFTNCKVPASVTWLPAQTPANKASNEVYVFNCASGDTHYDFGYYNALGEVVSQTSIYATGAKYDGTNGVGWQITTTSAANYYNPFVTPWIDLYHEGTSAITPSLEICRSGSATAYDNDEVWGEFSYQGTSGSTRASFVDDKMALAGTPAAQTTGDLGASDWTGENATSWFGKLHPASTITPAEIGMLRARVCAGVASSTVYVDPYIRVA